MLTVDFDCPTGDVLFLSKLTTMCFSFFFSFFVSSTLWQQVVVVKKLVVAGSHSFHSVQEVGS